MKKKFLSLLRGWPKPYITSFDLGSIFQCSDDALHSLLKRAVKEGILIRLKRDFYYIANSPYKPVVFEIAGLLYGPSYISLESALSFHGWIPESVPVITSVSTKRKKSLENYFGVFTYQAIPIEGFHTGVVSNYKSIQKNNMASFLIADPWKALADFIYLRRRSWPSVIALANDLRIELDAIQYSDLGLLEKLVQSYPNARVRKVLKRLAKGFDR